MYSNIKMSSTLSANWNTKKAISGDRSNPDVGGIIFLKIDTVVS